MAQPDIKQLLQAVYTKLSGVAALTAKLGTYKNLTCIFFSTTIPSAAPRPYIHVSLPTGFTDEDTINSNGWVLPVTLTVVDDSHESIIDLIDIVDLVKKNLIGQTLTLSTDTHHSTELISMTPAVVDNNLAGQRLTFSLRVSD
jgi:hypothetical protein